MAITTFIPKLWNARLLANLDKAFVYAKLMNRDYEGEIKEMGDTVHINSLNNIAIKKYTANTDIDPAEQLTTVDQTLKIDQGDYYNFYVNDVDRVQSAGNLMDKAMQRAGYGLAEKADTYLGNLFATEGKITKDLGSTGTPLVITKDNAYETLVKIKVALDKANVPKENRWVVMPPDFEGFMLLDPRFAGADGANAESRLMNGAVAKAAGLNIFISNNVPNTSNAKYKVVASYGDAGTYAEQIIKTEAYRRELGFDDGVKGLHVYGGKIVRPEAVAVATCNFTPGP